MYLCFQQKTSIAGYLDMYEVIKESCIKIFYVISFSKDITPYNERATCKQASRNNDSYKRTLSQGFLG
jgi:hypothetical protein